MKNLRYLRKKKGYTCETFGKKLGIGKSAVSKYERGEIQPSNEILIKMAEILDCTTDYLLGREYNTYPTQKENAPSAITTKDAIIAIFRESKGRDPTEGELKLFHDMTKPVLDSLPDKVD